MTADVPSNAQQSGIEIASTFGAASFGATVTGMTGAVGAGILAFFGSFGSAIGPPKWGNKVPKNQKFVTR